MRFGAVSAIFGLSVVALAQPEVVGNVRVEALTPNLVRIELKGPNGFEDRPTFHVFKRDWADVSLRRTEDGSSVTLTGPSWKVVIPKDAQDLSQVQVLDANGSPIYSDFANAKNSVWLPEPENVPPAWAFKDGPRLAPSSFGLTPAKSGDPLPETSGWDLANDSPDVYVFVPNHDYRTLRKDFLDLTGHTELPPFYMFGFIDSKWYAYTEQSALARIDDYRRRQIPLDVLVLDTDWRISGSHGYIPDSKLLPNLPRFFEEAHAKHVRVMFNDHPEPQAKTALDPKELNYRYDHLSNILGQGLDVWWYDRNWNVGLVEPLPGLRKEAWGMKLYHDMTLRERPNRRPVIMANVDGIDNGFRNSPPNVVTHRYPVQWTGDTSPTYDTLRRAVENALVSGVQGVNPYVLEDLGGHVAMPSPDLYVRFLEYGAFCPIMRVHCTLNLDHAPWIFGPEAEKITTDFIKLRYRLLPLIYESAHKATTLGEPIVRRLDLQYPKYPQAARNDQFLLGDGLLVAPIVSDREHFGLDAKLFHTPDGQPGLKGEYFANQTLEGDPSVVRTDPSLNFNWGEGSPDPKIPVDHFSARWTGTIGPIPGETPFHLAVTADDGVRVWIDDQLVVDQWHAEDSVTTEAAIELAPGSTHKLKVEYFEITGSALCRLEALGRKDQAGQRTVWIPPGQWTDLWTGKTLLGPNSIRVFCSLSQAPLYVKAGTVIPLAPDMQYTGQKPWSPLTLEVFPSREAAKTEIYEDDGQTNEYKKGAFRTTEATFQIKGDELIGHIQPNFQASNPILPANRSWKIRVHVPDGFVFRSASANGNDVPAKLLSKSGEAGMPLTGSGPSLDGQVLEFELPTRNVSQHWQIIVKGDWPARGPRALRSRPVGGYFRKSRQAGLSVSSV
jgi:hypothetical protein